MKELYNDNKLDLSIITINWNVTDKLQRCIDSVINTIKNFRYEMFVIDNNSCDADFTEIINKYSNYRQLIFIKNDKNEGDLVQNKIQDQIKGRYLMVLGPDAILTENAIAELVRFMDTTPNAGAASANLMNPDGTLQLYYYKFWNISMVFYIDTLLGKFIDKYLLRSKMSRHYLGKDLVINTTVEIDQPPGACLIARSELLLRDGYLTDPKFPFYYDDVDKCKRIHDKGYKIFVVPSAKVIHDQGSSFKKADPIWAAEEYVRSQLEYFKKHHRSQVILLKIIRPFHIPWLVVRLAPFVRFLRERHKKRTGKYHNILQAN